MEQWAALRAVKGLGNIGATPNIIKCLEHLLEHEDAWMRQAAIQTLGNFGKTTINQNKILSSLSTKTPVETGVRWMTLKMIGRIGKGTVTPDLISSLLDNLASNNASIQRVTIVTMGELGDKIFVDNLMNALVQEKDQNLKITAAESIRRLMAQKIRVFCTNDHCWKGYSTDELSEAQYGF